MTRHLWSVATPLEKVAGLDGGILSTVCGIELPDLPAGDMVAGDCSDCAACLYPTPTLIEEVLALRAWKAKVLAFAYEYERWDDVPAAKLYEVLFGRG